MFDIVEHNRKAWDKEADSGENPWTLPVSREEIERARHGKLEITVSAGKPVPPTWFPPFSGCRILCLASGGGQQGPLLAAAGAEVTVFDNSEKQLEKDRLVAKHEGLQLRIVRGDMQDLSAFSAGEFDLVVNPVSLQYIPDPLRVWKEAARVLKDGGILISGFSTPVFFLFNFQDLIRGKLTVGNKIPYSPFDESAKAQTEISARRGDHLWYGHTLETLLGGQLSAGFVITDLYEDENRGSQRTALDNYITSYLVTRAIKLRRKNDD